MIDGVKVLDYTIGDPEDPDWSFGIMELDEKDKLHLRGVLEGVLEKPISSKVFFIVGKSLSRSRTISIFRSSDSKSFASDW